MFARHGREVQDTNIYSWVDLGALILDNLGFAAECAYPNKHNIESVLPIPGRKEEDQGD